MNDLKRIAAVHDLSGVGKCSLSVALPVISATGVECACLPTALLSTHTGGFQGFTFRDLTDELLPIVRHWHAEGVAFDGIYSGYLASANQARALEEAIGLLATAETKIIVDPVMADNGSYYSKQGPEMCAAFQSLCRRADIITPNITEASLLTKLPYSAGPHDEAYIAALAEGLSRLCGGVIAITGVRPEAGSIGVYTVNVETEESCLCLQPAQEGVFCGTGDLFASAFAALTLRGAPLRDAAETATTLVAESIARTVARGTPRRNGVDFENALPNYIRQVERLFA